MNQPIKFAAICATLFGTAASLTCGCGPWMPTLLLGHDKQQALHAPTADVVTELCHLPALPKLPRGLKPHPFDRKEYEELRAGDLEINRNEKQDVAAALAYYGVPKSRRETVTAAYWKARKAILESRGPELHWAEADENLATELRSNPLPSDLPAELVQYLDGAIAFASGDLEKARQIWRELLARPAAERKFRSTWAAYMLGRIATWKDPDDEVTHAEAIRWFQEVRTLAQEGCEDGLNLVGMSYHWEAEIKWDDQWPNVDLEEQARLDGLSLATGSGWAVNMLESVGEKILDDDDDSVRAHAARVPLLRELATACALIDFSRRAAWPASEETATESQRLKRWLTAIENSGVKDVAGADRLAWACYDTGNFAAAAAWLKRAPANEPMVLWLRGKLDLRAGRSGMAVEHLARAARGLPEPMPAIYPQHIWWASAEADGFLFRPAQQIRGDLGIAQLAHAQFPQSLKSLLQSGAWLDAAYVAEQVMTTKELETFLRQYPFPKDIPATRMADPDGDQYPIANWRADVPQALRYLLARRLAREGQLDQAREYMPTALVSRFDEYTADIRRGHDPHLEPEERAAALWQAARIHRYLGMELFGSETAPDWSFYDGEYDDTDIGGVRTGTQPAPLWLVEKFARSNWVPRVSGDEMARNARLRPKPDARFHYRYVAAELGWQAAQLRPPDEETARMLCIAGGWIKNRDPKAADKFYQDLVDRCGQTGLGVEGEMRRWFPVVRDEPFEKPQPPP